MFVNAIMYYKVIFGSIFKNLNLTIRYLQGSRRIGLLIQFYIFSLDNYIIVITSIKMKIIVIR